MLKLTGITNGNMKRKDVGISLVGLHKHMRSVMIVVEGVWKKHGQEAVITAGTEAFKGINLIHSTNSLHPFGRALDFRHRYFSQDERAIIVGEVRKLLGKDYDVVLHRTHIHIEFDPR